MQQKSFTVVLAIATLLSVSCTQDDLRRLSPKNSIIASIQSPSTRTAVDNSPTEGSVSGIVWTKGDQLGVFDQTGASQTLYTKDGDEPQAKATIPMFLHISSDSDHVDCLPSGVVTATPEEFVFTTVVAVVATCS